MKYEKLNERQVDSDRIVHGTDEAHYAHQRSGYDVLVLDANSRKALATVRSLGKRGLRIAALEIASALPAPTFSSRWCQKSIICPAEEGTEAYLHYLESILDAFDIGVLIPSADGTIALVRQYRERLERRTRIALADEAALSIAMSKELTLEVAEQLGLAIPRGIPLSSVDEVELALREIGLPAVVKPTKSWLEDGQHGIRVAPRLVTTPAEARLVVEELTRFNGTVLFQRFLSGSQETVSLFIMGEEIVARFAYRSWREDPPMGGTSVVMQSMAYPADIGPQAELLVRKIGLTGYAHVEFRRDDRGKPYLMEINARLTAALGHAVQAGVDFPYLLYRWARGQPPEPVKDYRVGVRMRYLWGDIAGTYAAVRQHGRPGVPSPARAIFDFWASFFIPMRYDYLDWRDPMPVGSAIAARMRSGMKRIVRTLLRRKNVPGETSVCVADQERKAEVSHV